MNEIFKTDFGTSYHGRSEEIFTGELLSELANKVNLIFTSPPFPLNRKKKYGNLQGNEYIEWIASFAPLFKKLLTPDGSIVIEIGNAWEPKRPVMSTLPLKTLLSFLGAGNLNLCQQFIWYNPSRLPGPAEWVNVKRIRVKDSFTTLWWMSSTDNPKANNRNILSEYSDAMKLLLKSGKYNHGNRPSEHHIGATSFLSDNNGAIPSNVITAANTSSNDNYLSYCKDNDINPHPARMPIKVPEFFIKYLTDVGDLVLDPFAGSNTTGYVCEQLERKWVAVETNLDYINGSLGRFQNTLINPSSENVKTAFSRSTSLVP